MWAFLIKVWRRSREAPCKLQRFILGHLKVHSFLPSFIQKYLLRTYCVSGTALLGLRCIKTHSEGNTAIDTPTLLGPKVGAPSALLWVSIYLHSVTYYWHLQQLADPPDWAKGNSHAQVSDCSGTSLWHTLHVFTLVPQCWQVMEGFGACCQGPNSAPFQSAAELLFLKWEKAALPALKLSVKMAELMTLSQPSTNTQADIGLVYKCSCFHQRETSEASSVSPEPPLPPQ